MIKIDFPNVSHEFDNKKNTQNTKTIHALPSKNKYSIEDLFRAVISNDLELLEKGLKAGVDINLKDKYGYILLHEASSRGLLLAVELILKYKPDINAQNKDGNTPLYNAVLKNHNEIAEILLRADADPNIKVTGGFTALHVAATNGNLELLKLLKEYGGDLNIISTKNITLIHSAAFGVVDGKDNCWEVIEWAFKNGLEYEITAQSHKPVTDILKKNDYSDIEHYEEILGSLGYKFVSIFEE